MSFGLPKEYDKFRVPYEEDYGDSVNGFLVIKQKGLAIMFSNGEGWEHVSVSRRSKTPTYTDMCWVKNLFWSDDECVMQLHVPTTDHINLHQHCLHLWRPISGPTIPRPPSWMVG